MYNLRRTKTYQRQRCVYTKTQPQARPIGIRRKACPDQPGYIRIDALHQGDQDKRKGVYHINAVDEITQFQSIVTVEPISEHFMAPALTLLLDAYPFWNPTDNDNQFIHWWASCMVGQSKEYYNISCFGVDLLS